MRRTKPSPQGGYNMVMLMVAITVLNIMVAIALPMWSQEIQRDKEEELISRGWQYVEAIRVFNNRFQRMPIRLEELVEVKPRSIRKLWKDPMTDGKMQPIFQNEGQPLTVQPGVQQPQQGTGNPGGTKDPKPGQPDPNATPPDPNAPVDANGDKPQTLGGPIVGVRSRSNKKSILVFFGKERYDQWRFTLDAMRQATGGPPQGGGQGIGGVPGAAAGGPNAGLNLSTRWLGRPFPGVQTTDNLPKPGDLLPGSSGSKDGSSPSGSGRRPGGKVPRGGASL